MLKAVFFSLFAFSSSMALGESQAKDGVNKLIYKADYITPYVQPLPNKEVDIGTMCTSVLKLEWFRKYKSIIDTNVNPSNIGLAYKTLVGKIETIDQIVKTMDTGFLALRKPIQSAMVKYINDQRKSGSWPASASSMTLAAPQENLLLSNTERCLNADVFDYFNTHYPQYDDFYLSQEVEGVLLYAPGVRDSLKNWNCKPGSGSCVKDFPSPARMKYRGTRAEIIKSLVMDNIQLR